MAADVSLKIDGKRDDRADGGRRGDPLGGSLQPSLEGQIPNAIDPERLSAKDRIAAVCAILAAGLSRLRARQSREFFAPSAENFLDLPAQQSGHAPTVESSKVPL